MAAKLPSNDMSDNIETHPFEPFFPANARILMLGTFPPAPKRWCMRFYYPNFMNDMWRMMGYIFFGDKSHFVDAAGKTFKLEELKAFLKEKGLAFYDTAYRVRRTKNTASDKDLEVVEPTDLNSMLHQLSECCAVVTAGQLATQLFAGHFHIGIPEMGECVEFLFEGRAIRLYRMPSTSRAYPMSLERKAAYYSRMLENESVKSKN